jgi:excisionase family DNA binding protein
MATTSGLRQDGSEGSSAEHHGRSDDFTLLTVDDVAAMLKVSKSWVYEHTRARGTRGSGLPFVKVGKYVRFDARLVREFLAARMRRA